MKIKEIDFCPECGIGLNRPEINLGFCQNCKANWEPEEVEDEFFDDDEV